MSTSPRGALLRRVEWAASVEAAGAPLLPYCVVTLVQHHGLAAVIASLAMNIDPAVRIFLSRPLSRFVESRGYAARVRMATLASSGRLAAMLLLPAFYLLPGVLANGALALLGLALLLASSVLYLMEDSAKFFVRALFLSEARASLSRFAAIRQLAMRGVLVAVPLVLVWPKQPGLASAGFALLVLTGLAGLGSAYWLGSYLHALPLAEREGADKPRPPAPATPNGNERDSWTRWYRDFLLLFNLSLGGVALSLSYLAPELLSFFYGGSVFGFLVVARLGRELDRRADLDLVYRLATITAAGIAVLPLGSPLCWVGAPVAGFAYGVSIPAVQTLVLSKVQGRGEATRMATGEVAGRLGALAAIFLVGLAMDAGVPPAALVEFGAVLCLAGLLALRYQTSRSYALG